MLLSVNQKPPSNIKNTSFENTFEWDQTPKGYMNHDSMLSWIKNILISYVNERRDQLNNQILHALLLFGGLKAHLMEDTHRAIAFSLFSFTSGPRCFDLQSHEDLLWEFKNTTFSRRC